MPAAATDSVPDYGSAFGMLSSFGLESAEPGGQYVALQMYEGSSRGSAQPVGALSQLPLANKAWIWPGTNGQPTRYLYVGGRGGWCRAEGPAAANDAGENALPIAAWSDRDADWSNDVAGVLSLLRPVAAATNAAAGKEDEEDGDRNDYVRRQFERPEVGGALLLAAAHVYQAGGTNEANEIADRLFAMAPDRPAVVRQAAAHLAQIQYVSAGDRLANTGDWPAYRDDLKNVLARFGTAWDKAPGLEILIAKVEQRLAGAPPSGEGLDADAARFLARPAPEDAQLIGQLHLAAVLNPAVQLALLSEPGDRPAARFFARGIHMLPALLAVADSDYLLPAPLEFPNTVRYGSYSYSSRSGAGLKSAEEIYRELDGKPPALGDAAANMLQLLVPQSREALTTPEYKSNVVAAARVFYAAHAADSPLALAAAYLAEGREEQRAAAANVLLQSQNTNALALAEGYLFSTSVWSRSSYSLLDHAVVSHVQSYALKHPDRARTAVPPFLETLRAQLPERLALLNESRRKQEEQNAHQIFSGLEKSIGIRAETETPAEEPDANGPGPLQQAANELMRKTEGLPAEAACGAFLDGIVAQTNAETRFSLLMTFSSIYRYRWDQRKDDPRQSRMNAYQRATELSARFDDALFLDPDYAAKVAARAAETRAAAGPDDGPDAPASAPGRPALAAASQWEVLLADRRAPKPAGFDLFGETAMGSSSAVADMAAFALGSIVLDAQSLGENRQLEIRRLGDRLNPYWLRVARAALDGAAPGDLPPLPKAENVAAETVAGLSAKLQAAAPGECADVLRGLEPDVLLALAREAEKHAPLREALAPAANRVVGIDASGAPALAARLEPFAHDSLSVALFDRLLETATALATQSVAAAVVLRRASWLEGCTLSVATNLPQGYDSFGGGGGRRMARILVFCHGGNEGAYAQWTVAAPAAAAPAPDDPAARMRKLMERFGVSIEDTDVSPEMLEQMAAAMEASESSSGPSANPEEQDKLRKTVGQFADGRHSPLDALTLAFMISLPPTDPDHQPNEVSDFYDEVYIE
ncbi:MAG: hypothetical protein AB7V22_00980 [Kiritimatiellia bacterium]